MKDILKTFFHSSTRLSIAYRTDHMASFKAGRVTSNYSEGQLAGGGESPRTSLGDTKVSPEFRHSTHLKKVGRRPTFQREIKKIEKKEIHWAKIDTLKLFNRSFQELNFFFGNSHINRNGLTRAFY